MDDKTLGKICGEDILKLIQEDIRGLGSEAFDEWFEETDLFDAGDVQQILSKLKEKDYLEEKDGALFFSFFKRR